MPDIACVSCGDTDQVVDGRCRTCRPKVAPTPAFTNAAERYVHDTITRIRDSLDLIERELPDTKILAADRPATGEPSTTTQPTSRVLAEQGDPRAKLALAALLERRTGLPHADDVVQKMAQGMQALFRGPGADDTLPGSLLDEIDPVTGRVAKGGTAREVLARQLDLQQRRAARGDYTPARAEIQPKAPAYKGSCLCRGHPHAAPTGTSCRVCNCTTIPKGAA